VPSRSHRPASAALAAAPPAPPHDYIDECTWPHDIEQKHIGRPRFRNIDEGTMPLPLPARPSYIDENKMPLGRPLKIDEHNSARPWPHRNIDEHNLARPRLTPRPLANIDESNLARPRPPPRPIANIDENNLAWPRPLPRQPANIDEKHLALGLGLRDIDEHQKAPRHMQAARTCHS
jgi:hypothetical protein